MQLKDRRTLLVLTLGGTLFACTLPGAASPTPFAFPTPDVTLTAMFADTVVPTQPPPTITLEPETSVTPTPDELAPAATPEPNLTATPISTDTRPNGEPVEAALLSSAPTVDGDLSEWLSSTFEVDKIVFGASNWSGTSDASGTAYIGWTADALFVAVRVTDDAFVQVSSGSNIFKGDEVELQLDTNLAGDYYSNVLSADDYQIGLSPGNFSTLPKESWRWYPISTRGPLSSFIAIQATARADGYDIEAKIPWSVLGIAPAAGDRFGFAFSISDNDLKGAPIQQSMVSNVRSRTLSNPTTWGTLILGQ